MRHQKCPACIAGAHARDLPKAQSAHSYAAMHRTACFRPHSKGTAFMSIRPVKRIIQSKPTIEGAGVKLARAFGFGDTAEFDPFLLLDDFRNDRPEDYRAGFPWHPHRGIETITYVLAGTVTSRARGSAAIPSTGPRRPQKSPQMIRTRVPSSSIASGTWAAPMSW